MTHKERTAIVRILRDLIKADAIIDSDEIQKYTQLRHRYKITHDEEVASVTMPLADAVGVLAKSRQALRQSLLQTFTDIVLSDGFCAAEEALMLVSLMYCLKEEYRGMAEVYSVYAPEVAIEDHQVVYVEAKYDEQVNDDIKRNYRAIDRELHLAGFDFSYIPNITEHFRNTDLWLFKDVTRFLAPTIAEDKVENLVKDLVGVTTAEYCADQLVNRLGMVGLRDASPSLLIKIGDTYVGDRPYINFLRLAVDDDVLPMVQQFVDTYTSLLSSDVRVVKHSQEDAGQFMYYGFYKQLFDVYVIQKGVRSNLLIDLVGERILLPGLGREIKGLHRRDKALYALLLMEGERGGLDFSLPKTLRQKQAYERRMAEIQAKYTQLYQAFNGDKGTVPNLEIPEIRRPIVSNIRRRIKEISSVLHNPEDYNVSTDSQGYLCVNLPAEWVDVREYSKDGSVDVPMVESAIFEQLMRR
jgi:hypothetical protein